jgi:hypothetical protein
VFTQDLKTESMRPEGRKLFAIDAHAPDVVATRLRPRPRHRQAQCGRGFCTDSRPTHTPVQMSNVEMRPHFVCLHRAAYARRSRQIFPS